MGGLITAMKIAHVVDSMEVGGAETLVSQMCRLQRAQGHDPCIYALAALGRLGEQMQREGFKVNANVGRHMMDSARTFYRIFRDVRPDAVHLHNPTPTIYAAFSARMAGVPSIVSTRHSLVAPPRRHAEEMKYAVASLFCDWIAGVCEATATNLRSLHGIRPKKIVRVYNGVAALRRVPMAECPARSGFTFLYVGRLETVKNHGLLLRAFQIAVSSKPDLRLWMVGDGGERKPLERLAADLGIAGHVCFFGEQADVSPFFCGADAFVMSSRSEGLPLSLLQGFSLGMPAVVTNVGGMAEVVRMAGAGLTVPAAGPAEMAAAMLRVSSEDALRSRFSENAKSAFRSHFSIEAVVSAYAELYANARPCRVRQRD